MGAPQRRTLSVLPPGLPFADSSRRRVSATFGANRFALLALAWPARAARRLVRTVAPANDALNDQSVRSTSGVHPTKVGGRWACTYKVRGRPEIS